MMTETLRLLYINRVINYQDGSGVHGRSFVDAFAAQGEITTFPPIAQHADIPWHRPVKLPSILGKPINHWVPTPFEVMLLARELRRSLRDYRQIQRVIGDWRPQALMVRQQGVDFVAALLARQLSLPVVLEVNTPLWIEVSRERPSGWLDIYRRSEEWAWRSSSAIFVVSSVLKEMLVDVGIAKEKVHVNPNGVNEKLFDPALYDPEESRQRLGLPGSVPIIGFTGSLRPWHGIQGLLEAFNQLVLSGRDVYLLLVGDGPEKENTNRWLAEHGLSNCTCVVGHAPHSDLPMYISAMSICVAPYPLVQPFYFSPLKVIEYMAMGKPIVASRIGQVTELLGSGSGFLVSPGDVQDLVTTLGYVLAHPDEGRQVGAQAREKVLGFYTWSHNAQRVFDVLKHLSPEVASDAWH